MPMKLPLLLSCLFLSAFCAVGKANHWTTMLQDAGAGVDRFADANATAHSIWGQRVFLKRVVCGSTSSI